MRYLFEITPQEQHKLIEMSGSNLNRAPARALDHGEPGRKPGWNPPLVVAAQTGLPDRLGPQLLALAAMRAGVADD